MSQPQDKMLNRRYSLDQQQGSGGMAVIYKATDVLLGRVVAVKILRPSLTNDHMFLVRFRQEARNVANLAHPNIVTVHDVGQDSNTHYIVMEFIDGQNLKDIIRESSPLAISRFLDLMIQICAGIGYAHRAGLVHADVKPQNILVTHEDKVKVTDFGIAQALAATQPEERQKVVWGSPHYFSPEQAQGEYPTPASDVYSIGVVMFEMLTGRLPFTGMDQQELALAHIRNSPPRITDVNAQIPPDLERIVMKALAKDPNARYKTADQLGRILIAYKEKGQEPTDDSNMRSPSASAPVITSPAQQSTPTPAPVQGKTVQPDILPYAGALATAQHQPVSPAVQRGGNAPIPYSASEAATQEGPSPYYQQEAGHYNTPQPYPGSPYDPPDIMSSRGYRAYEPTGFDWVTLALAGIALLSVSGVVILWIFVWQAYFG